MCVSCLVLISNSQLAIIIFEFRNTECAFVFVVADKLLTAGIITCSIAVERMFGIFNLKVVYNFIRKQVAVVSRLKRIFNLVGIYLDINIIIFH